MLSSEVTDGGGGGIKRARVKLVMEGMEDRLARTWGLRNEGSNEYGMFCRVR